MRAGDREGRARGERPEPAIIPIRSGDDLMPAREAVRTATAELGFTSLADQTKIVTAASELVRNCYVHGGGGTLTIERVNSGGRMGLRLTVSDRGSGISDVEAALTDGYSTGMGLGYGLGGVRRLVDEFHLDSEPGKGTTVVAVRWR